ncbi:hypothetical protein PIB30_029872 [Stylosanthes scabra]|uniref:Aminotransferase-like plant mobile domain-containing protein n=1 Tax=Stylosanthes scabra TaxID=79078 RepID=A0ABU6Z946_9FABA|nr:hypothetical protein [Stylosanthes scabra]
MGPCRGLLVKKVIRSAAARDGATSSGRVVCGAVGLLPLAPLNEHWFKVDMPLISAFVEQWRPETRLFHMLWGDYTRGCGISVGAPHRWLAGEWVPLGFRGADTGWCRETTVGVVSGYVREVARTKASGRMYNYIFMVHLDIRDAPR